MELKVSGLAERPERYGQVAGMADTWPEFIRNDLVGTAHYGRTATELSEHVLFAGRLGGQLVRGMCDGLTDGTVAPG